MTPARSNPIPLPCAVLALSVAVCIGAAGAASGAPTPAERAAQAEQRETLEHLLGAIQQAARKLTDQLTGHAAAFDRPSDVPVDSIQLQTTLPAGADTPAIQPLREALLNLPPPSC